MSTSISMPAPDAASQRAGGSATENQRHTIELDEVRKSFGDTLVLDGVTGNVVDDAITTILGPSGTGKSVLLKHIVGLLEPDDGDVRVFGENLWALRESERFELRKRFGLLFQDGALFGSMNLYDNVAFPLRKHTGKSESEVRKIVMHYLEQVGLEDATERAPNEISGGMRKRAGFARALVMEPDIVMFDEPDSGLDPVRTKLLCNLIVDLHKEHGGTYVVITHDIDTSRTLSDYIGVLWKGKLEYFGTADGAFECDDAFVQQFLSAEADGPLGM